jgi:hypothetical protein
MTIAIVFSSCRKYLLSWFLEADTKLKWEKHILFIEISVKYRQNEFNEFLEFWFKFLRIF